MLHRPKKRSWPSRNCMSLENVRRQPAGDTKGKIPSSTSIRASAAQNVSPSKAYLRAGAGDAALPLPPLRKVRKKSELAGSTTTTSLFLLKLCL